jgi:hypothetical protein
LVRCINAGSYRNRCSQTAKDGGAVMARRYRVFEAWIGFDKFGVPVRPTFDFNESSARAACRAITSKVFPIKIRKVTLRALEDASWGEAIEARRAAEGNK